MKLKPRQRENEKKKEGSTAGKRSLNGYHFNMNIHIFHTYHCVMQWHSSTATNWKTSSLSWRKAAHFLLVTDSGQTRSMSSFDKSWKAKKYQLCTTLYLSISKLHQPPQMKWNRDDISLECIGKDRYIFRDGKIRRSYSSLCSLLKFIMATKNEFVLKG